MGPMHRDECFRILEVHPTATDDEIRTAWLELNKVWHPDRFGNDEALRRKAEEKLKRINQAYETLRRNGSRGSGSEGSRSQTHRNESSDSSAPSQWKIRDDRREVVAKNFEQLARWVLGGKVVGSDEVWDPRAETWLRVSSVPELARIIRIRTIQKWTRFALFAGMLGFFLLIRRPAGLTAVIGLALIGFAFIMMWLYRRAVN